MRLIRYQPEYQEAMLALHRSAIEGFTLGMTQQQDEADLVAIEEVYLRSRGEFLLGFVGERLVAMGGFKRLSEGVAELRRMRIARDLQGLGYGTLMLRELERRAFVSGRLSGRPRHLVALVFVRSGGHLAFRRHPLCARPPRQVRVLQQDQNELENQAREGERGCGELSRGRRPGHTAVGGLDRSNFGNFNPVGFQPNDDHAPRTSRMARSWCLPSTMRWPPARSGRKRCWSSPMTSMAASSSRRAARRAGRRPAGVRPLRAAGTGAGRLAVGRATRGSHTVLDHTSIIKTILLRFCPDALNDPERHHGLLARVTSAGRPHPMGARVAHAHDLGELLTRTVPRPAPARYALIHDAAARAATRTRGEPIDGDPLVLHPATDLQLRIAAAIRELRIRGHPTNRS